MAANPAMSTFLSNPTMEGKNKKDVLAKLGKEASFHPFTSNFLNLLVDKSRIGQLDAIAEEFESLYCAQTDTQVSEHPPPRRAQKLKVFPFFATLWIKCADRVPPSNDSLTVSRSHPFPIRLPP